MLRWGSSCAAGDGGRVRTPAPTAENSLGTLARQTQAQTWNRTKNKFCKLRAQWPGGKLGTHSNFARRKLPHRQGVTPVMGVRGKRRPSRSERSCPSERPRGRFGYFAAMGKVSRRPQAAKSPSKKRNVNAPHAQSGLGPFLPIAGTSPDPCGLRPVPPTGGIGPLRGVPPGGRLTGG